MNAAHLHLALNHLPVLGTALGAALLIVGLLRKSAELKKITLAFLAVIAALAIPVYLTGEPAEELVEGLPGVNHVLIEEHEEGAAFAFASVLLTGLTALGGLIGFRKGRIVPQWFGTVVLALSLVTAGLMVRTASAGGEIRHTEIRKDQTAVPSQPAKGGNHND